jgi:hypothetical protein
MVLAVHVGFGIALLGPIVTNKALDDATPNLK